MSLQRPLPWLRSASEHTPPRGERHVTAKDAIIVTLMAAVVVAMAVWFLIFASGGIGPGSI
jgi:hypothetical protein